jgi:hypothetical protein
MQFFAIILLSIAAAIGYGIVPDLASYGTGLIGGIVLIVWVWRRRRTLEAGGPPIPQSA